jgi:hypothetical protein
MRRGLLALLGLTLTACSEGAANVYPQAAQTRFEASCPMEDPVCRCTWERLTQTLTYEDYEAALARFRESGLMDPRVTRVRTRCIERHGRS